MGIKSAGIEMVRVRIEDLSRFADATLRAIGMDSEQAAIVGSALLYSELRFHPGQGQGVRRLVAYAERVKAGHIDLAARPRIVKESPSLALVDAGNGLGSVAGVTAMRLAAQKAKACGIGTVLVRGSTHWGSSAVHAAEALEHSCIGIAYTNAGPEMAAWGGASPAVGTNPWAIAAPTDRVFPVVLDIALTTAGKGMMRWHAREGLEMPLDWALTPDGHETTDPNAAMTGALLGIGRYKGYGLAFMTDVLTGVLAGGGFGLAPYADPARTDVSHSVTAIDIGWFQPEATFRARMGAFIDEIKAGRKRPGVDKILVPGELEHRRVVEKTRSGVPLDRVVFDELAELGRSLGLGVDLGEGLRDAA